MDKTQRKIKKVLNLIFKLKPLRDLLSSLGIFVIDYKGRRVSSNDLWNALGHPGEHSYEGTWTRYLHPDDRKRVEANFREMMNGEVDFCRDVYRCKDSSGDWWWVANRSGIACRDKEGRPLFSIGVDEELTRIKAAQEEASMRARDAAALNASIEIINSSLDLGETVKRVLEQARHVVPYDRATVQILHDGVLEVLGGMGFSNPAILEGLSFPFAEEGSLSTRAIQERRPLISKNVEEDYPKFFQVENSYKARSWIGVPLIAHGDVIGLISFDSGKVDYFTPRHLELARAFAGPVAIAMENARMHGEAYRLAMEDALTGIGSRHAFDLNGLFVYEKARREGQEISIAMLDIDRFKEVNDEFGHPVGDIVLKNVARTCEAGLRASDMIARYGGEELVMLFPETGTEAARDIVERIRREVENLKHPGMDLRITISAGISGGSPRKGSSLIEMIREADAALYNAKTSGRNRVVTHL